MIATTIQGRKLLIIRLFECDNYSRETTIQRRKLFAEIRYLTDLKEYQVTSNKVQKNCICIINRTKKGNTYISIRTHVNFGSQCHILHTSFVCFWPRCAIHICIISTYIRVLSRFGFQVVHPNLQCGPSMMSCVDSLLFYWVNPFRLFAISGDFLENFGKIYSKS